MAFNPQAYLQARQDLVNNFENDPALRAQFGTLEKYAKADFDANRQGHPGTQFTPEWYAQFDQPSEAVVSARDAYLNSGDVLPNYTDEGFINWWREAVARGEDPADYPADFELLAALAEDGKPAAVATLNTAGYEDTQADAPLEQGILDAVTPGLLSDIEADVERRRLAGELGGELREAVDTARGTLEEATSGRLLQSDYANADRTTAANVAAIDQSIAAQLAALQEQTAAQQANLTGEAAERAAALQQQIASLTANLEQLDATQRAAILQQIQDLQANLDESLQTQRGALEAEIAALEGAAGAQAQARRAALQSELQALSAAQAPLAEARIRAAELQATGINAGLQSTQDQLRAQAAREGFVGGSTMQDAALARAAIDARQGAAQALGGARLENAADTREIAIRGATGERTIAEELANAQREIAGQRATGTAALTTAGALGRQQIGDAGSADRRGLTDRTATGRADILNTGATTTYQDAVGTAGQRRALADALAAGTAGVKTSGAQQTQGARIAGNTQKSDYYNNDYSRRLGASLQMPSLVTDLTAGLTALDNYGRSGLARTQGLLNWWGGSPGTPPVQEFVAVQPSTSGNSLSNLGSTLLAAGANLWKPKVKDVAPKVGDFNYNAATAATA